MFKFVLGDEQFRFRFKAGYQVWDGLGFYLTFLQALRMRDSAAITLEKLLVLVRRSEMRLERGLTGSFTTQLIFVSGSEDERMVAHFLIGQELFGWERKLPWSQK